MSKRLYRSDSLDSGAASMGADDDCLNEDLLEMETFSDCDQLLSSSDSDEIRNNFKCDSAREDSKSVSISRRSSRRVTFDPNVLMKQAILEGDFSTLRTLLCQDAIEHGHQFQRGDSEDLSSVHCVEGGGGGGRGVDSAPMPSTCLNGLHSTDDHSNDMDTADEKCNEGADVCITTLCSPQHQADECPKQACECAVEIRQTKGSSSSAESSSSVADCDMSGVPDSPLCRSPRHSGVPRVDVNATDNDGLTLLHLCCFAGAGDCVKLLVERGAEVDAADEAGWTPLHVAAYEGLADVVRTLASAGAALEAKDEEGLRPLDVASSERIRDVFEGLKVNVSSTSSSTSSSGGSSTSSSSGGSSGGSDMGCSLGADLIVAM